MLSMNNTIGPMFLSLPVTIFHTHPMRMATQQTHPPSPMHKGTSTSSYPHTHRQAPTSISSPYLTSHLWSWFAPPFSLVSVETVTTNIENPCAVDSRMPDGFSVPEDVKEEWQALVQVYKDDRRCESRLVYIKPLVVPGKAKGPMKPLTSSIWCVVAAIYTQIWPYITVSMLPSIEQVF